MTFTDFLDENENSLNCKREANNTNFDQEIVSLDDFIKLYHKAVRLGLCADDAAVFKNKFKVDIDTRIDAQREGLSETDWICKNDPHSIWYADKHAEVAERELARKAARNNGYIHKSEGTISASRITAEDLKRYAMPHNSLKDEVDDFVKDAEQELRSFGKAI